MLIHEKKEHYYGSKGFLLCLYTISTRNFDDILAELLFPTTFLHFYKNKI